VNLRRPRRSTSWLHLRASFAAALCAVSYPFRFWNWKAASLNIAIRSSAYFFIALHHGHQAGVHAAVIEAVYVCLTAGFFSALQQGAMRAKPRWLASLIIILGVPVFAQTVDYFIQHAAGTPNMKATSVGMVFWGLLSAAFHLHLMRNGAMLVGEGERSFSSDLRRIPRLVFTFVAAPVIVIGAALRTREEASQSKAAA
jgi:hypothetical protein